MERLPYTFVVCPLRAGVSRLLFCLGECLGNIALVQELLVLGIVLNVDENGFPTAMICDDHMVVVFEHIRNFSVMVAQIAGWADECLHHGKTPPVRDIVSQDDYNCNGNDRARTVPWPQIFNS